MRIALKRQALVAAMIGPDGPAEMRLTRLAAGDLRRDPAGADRRAQGRRASFPARAPCWSRTRPTRTPPPIAAALADWRPGDAALVVAAGELRAGSALRKAFEAVEDRRRDRDLRRPARPRRDRGGAWPARRPGAASTAPAMADLEALGRSLDPGDFAQFLEKLALYKLGDPAPLGPADIAAVAPPGAEAEADAILDLAAEGRADALPEAMARLGGAPRRPTGLVIAAGRHFRALHAAACAAEGPEAALGPRPAAGLRPAPRPRMAAQARGLGPARLERALALILEADLALRSTRPPPGRALAERLLVRIAPSAAEPLQ